MVFEDPETRKTKALRKESVRVKKFNYKLHDYYECAFAGACSTGGRQTGRLLGTRAIVHVGLCTGTCGGGGGGCQEHGDA